MRTVAVVKILLFFSFSASAQSSSNTTQAQWMLERLTGVHWAASSPLIAQMAQKISNNDLAGAAQIATAQPQFLNVTVKQMALKLSTREETVRLPLNDFAASFIGVTRDGIDARQLLYGNFYYMADVTKLPSAVATNIPVNLANDLIMSNNHYQALETNNVDYGAVLKQVSGQMLVLDNNGTTGPNPDAAGVLTSRTFLQAHAVAGTNRRLVEYTFREFMCIPLINWADIQASDIRVGRDVDRVPGGNNTTYETSCKGCHSQADSFRGAFAKWDWNSNAGLATYATSGGTGNAAPAIDGSHPQVMMKLNKNGTVFPDGYVSVDDSWINNANRGVNATLFSWRGQAPAGGSSAGGNGANQFGRLVANSPRFSQCMAQHVFQAVCQKTLSTADAQVLYVSLGMSFEANAYNLKKLFETVATNPNCQP